MPYQSSSEIAPFDAVEVCEAVLEAAEGPVHIFGEFDYEEANPLYVDDWTESLYSDETQMLEHFEQVHSYTHLDFTEMNLFTKTLFPQAGEVRYITISMELFTMLRFYKDGTGLLITVEPDEPIGALVDVVQDEIGDDR